MVEEHLNWPIYRATPQGGYSGFGTARGLAKLYSIVVSGKHHNGSPLLSPKTVGRLHTILSDNVDYVFRIPMVFGYGVNIIDMGSKVKVVGVMFLSFPFLSFQSMSPLF